MFPIPVLITIFNRADTTSRVLDAVAAVKPSTLLVAADGPRNIDEKEKCIETRKIVERINWPCEVLTNFSDENLGCGVRVQTAIDWAFSRFEELIILEDDCVPVPSFFSYCAELLQRYRQDERIMHIGGFNLHPAIPVTEETYFFSKYTIASGAWATWRRAWKHFDSSLATWPEAKRKGILENWCEDRLEREHWASIFDRMSLGAPDVWDYQWTYSCWSQNGLSILPCVPLAINIGFGKDATHTTSAIPILERQPGEVREIHHPSVVTRLHAIDNEMFEQSMGGSALRRASSWQFRIRHKSRHLLSPLRKLKRIIRNALAGGQDVRN